MAKIVRVREPKTCWWEGREVYCAPCGCSFVLEARDKVAAIVPGPDYGFQVPCPHCNRLAILTRPDSL